jgi:predicted dienelactone hydrolase
MRPLEILSALLLAIYLSWPLILRHARPQAVRLLPPLALLLALAHFALEGYRWQMIPLYVMTAATAVLNLPSLFNMDHPNEPARGWRTAASILTLGLLAVSTALPVLLPVPRVPAPSRHLQIGTTSFELTDTSRKEIYSGRNEPRKFMVQVWYPADPLPENPTAPWMPHPEVFAPAIATFLHLPSFFLDHLELVKTPASLDAPLADSSEPYPLILFSHGWNGFNAQNSGQMIELASHGYVVAAINHTYGAIATVFPNGEIAYNNPDALPEGAPEGEYEIAARKLVDQWAGDLAYTLDFLSSGDEFSPAAVDFTRVGVFGHSTGGGAAIQFCGTDPRCDAVLTEDAFMTPVSQAVLDGGVPQPFFFLFSQQWADDLDSKNNRLFNQFYGNLSQPAPVVTILGTRHYDFSDLPLLSPLAPQLGLKGPINGKLVVKIINDYLLAYFNQSLKDIPSPLLFGPSEDYPDLRWEKQ